MKPYVILDRVALPGGEMVLARRDNDYSIRVRGVELMNSRNHTSEDELGRRTAELARHGARVLVGGLGLGYTLRKILDGCTAAVDLVELVPAVVQWHRDHVGALAGNPIADPRVTVIEDDVGRVIADAPQDHYAAIVLDVDNGPDELFESNAKLYKRNGLAAAKRALAPGGGLAVWSAFGSKTFTAWLREVGFVVEIAQVAAHGAHHTIWLARKPD